jgi:hypothetical protein
MQKNVCEEKKTFEGIEDIEPSIVRVLHTLEEF